MASLTAEAFQAFHVGRKLGGELAAPFDKTKGHPAALTRLRYGVSKKELLKACIERELLLMKRNLFVYIFRSFQLLLLNLITITVFLRTKMHHDSVTDGSIFMGALFFSVTMIMFNGLAEVALTVGKLPVFYKQRDLMFFPAWAYALPSWILKMPITFIEVAVWEFTGYYVIGFDPNVGRLFKQYLLLFLTGQMASALFRLIGALGRNMIIVNTFGSLAILAIMALGGFVLSRENVKKWWKWGYWISPVMYSQNAISVNEFLGKSWSKSLLGSMETLGASVLKSRGVFTDGKWYWIGVGALSGYIVLFNGLFTVALTYLHPFGKAHAVVSEESLAEKHANLTGESVELPSRGRSSSEHVTAAGSAREGAVASFNRKKKGMDLPFAPLSMTFDNIRYSVDMPEEMKAQGVSEDRLELLKGLSGSFRPGVLTALMGASGAGKTTLMDVLSRRKTGGYIEESITISGYPKKQETFARKSGYYIH